MPSHTHTTHHEGDFAAGGYAQFGGGGSAYNSEVESSSAGSDAAHNNTQPYLVVNYIIKT
jgi:microcystin-dependent protein